MQVQQHTIFLLSGTRLCMRSTCAKQKNYAAFKKKKQNTTITKKILKRGRYINAF